MLDLSNNKLSGEISRNLTNMRAFIDNVTLQPIDTNAKTEVNYRVSLSLSPFKVDLSFIYQRKVYTFNGNGLVWTAILNLGANNLTGRIPDDILQMDYLWVLNLSNNALSGTIPDKEGSLKKLQSLDLSSNRLTGPVPVMLARMPATLQFYLGGNDLSGEIPQENGFGTRTTKESFRPGNEGLCGLPLEKQCESRSVWSIGGTLSVPGICVGLLMGFGGVALMIVVSPRLRRYIFHPKETPKAVSAWRGHS